MKNNKFLMNIFALRLLRSAMVLLLVVIMASCGEDGDGPGDAPLDIGTLETSKAEVVVDYDKPTEEAVRFSWHAEKNAAIEYQLIFTSGTLSDTVEVLSEVSKKFIYAQFNRLLLGGLHLEIGKKADIGVVLFAKTVKGNKTATSNAITVSVTPSPLLPEPPLEAVVLAANRSNAVIDMANAAGETVSFAWGEERNPFIEYQLVLASGPRSVALDVSTDVSKEFTHAELNGILVDKLMLEQGKAAPLSVTVRASVTISDKKVTSNTVDITATPGAAIEVPPAYNKMWIVGNATPNGWNIGDPNVMANDPTHVFQFKYNEVLNAGEFKLPVATGNWGGDYYMPPVNHQDLSLTTVAFITGGNPDNKWEIKNPGAYKMVLNISDDPFMKITPFTPFGQIYILGDATDAGWDPNNAIAMTVDAVDPNVFTWTGELKSAGRGQFRFPTSAGELGGSAFVAPVSGASITDTRLAFTPNSTPANNFKVKEGEEGTYKITINQLRETISIVKQ